MNTKMIQNKTMKYYKIQMKINLISKKMITLFKILMKKLKNLIQMNIKTEHIKTTMKNTMKYIKIQIKIQIY